MNVYDAANELASGMRASQEYKRLAEAKQKLSSDPQAGEMVKDFMKQKQEIELEQLSGKTPAKEKIEQVQKVYELLCVNPVANDYVQAYIRFQLMINDVSKTIGDVVKEVAGE
ncbi:MAG TPA: YlbF family regulator [Candidatus Avacidaminococcus intestinavium]|uniref:YlbF family regulator n=1 Tax=Candidatus Avacidaminococcus intestinavium TaxID=2840684 RepID=A0A9D1SLV3_9FIRM|nr:YlbF family regulator [Candidatus Avacidaminococcus intestinavium]